MNLGKTVLLTILNVVLVNGRYWFSSTCETPEWYCDSNKIGSDIKSFYDIEHWGLFSFCVEGKWCKSYSVINEITDLRVIDLVLVNSINHLPRCMIMNFPQLKTIHAMNAKISSMEAWAFWNLTKLKEINLSYNKITEIEYGVFNGLPIYQLDLSWNEIKYIGQGAFHDMRNLKTLDISRNYLTLFDNSYFAIKDMQKNVEFPLEVLLLKQNKLNYVYLQHFPYLDIIDLSHNDILRIFENETFASKIALAKLDLTDNSLTELILSPDWHIGTLRISFNNFMHPKYLIINSVRLVALDGNPWECKEYTRVLHYLIDNRIKLLKHNEDEQIYFLTALQRENYPFCYVSSDNYTEDGLLNYLSLKDIYKNQTNQECKTNYDCQTSMICKNGRCWKPCKQNVCHKSAICRANEHSFFCECPKGKLVNPHRPQSRCYHVECFHDFDCQFRGKCNTKEHICEEENY